VTTTATARSMRAACARAGRCASLTHRAAAQARICAGRRCLTECSDAATDCAANQTCDQVKTQYGEVPGPKACNGQQSQSGACQSKCEVRASTLADESLAAFVACMQDGAADCSVIDTCRALFPGGH